MPPEVPEALSTQVPCASVCLSVCYSLHAVCESVLHLYISWINEGILMKLIAINNYQRYVTLMSLRRSLGQRSRSFSNDHRHFESRYM